MIIDAHVHINGPPLTDEKVTFIRPDGSPIPTQFKRIDGSVDRLLEVMDKHNIDTAVVNAFPGCITNKQLAEILKEHKGRLMGFAWVDNPLEGTNAITQFENAFNEQGFVGLKLNPGLQGFNPADPKLIPLVRKTAELGAPIFIHTAPWPQGELHLNVPENIDILKKHVPEATIIVGHMGYQRFMDLLALAWHSGIYFETSFGLELISNLHGIKYAERFIRMLGIDRVVFGSDWLGQEDRITNQNLDIISKMELTIEEKAKILGENMKHILPIM